MPPDRCYRCRGTGERRRGWRCCTCPGTRQTRSRCTSDRRAGSSPVRCTQSPPSHTLPPLPRTPCPRRTPCPLHALRPLPCLHCQPADCARGPLPVSCFRPTAATDCRGLAVPARLHLPQPPRHFQPMHGTAILYRPLLSARSARICLTAHQLAATVNTVPPPASQALPRLISRIQLTG